MDNPADVAFFFLSEIMYLCWILLVLGDLIFVLLSLLSQLRKEPLDSVYVDFDGLVTPLRNSKMPGCLFFHLCFSFTVSEPSRCYQRAGILHSFSSTGAVVAPKFASVQNYACGASNVPCTVSCLLF